MRLSRSRSSGVFRRPLKEVSEAGLPPKIFAETITYLSQRGLTVPQLFAELRNVRKIQIMQQLYEANQEPWQAIGAPDAFTVAGVLRLWLSCLPEPLIPWQLAQDLVLSKRHTCCDDLARQMELLLTKVPACNLAVLLPLMEFLHHYSLNHPDADLPAKFVPIFLGSMGSCSTTLQEHSAEAEQLVAVLIADYRSLRKAHAAICSARATRPPSPGRKRRMERDVEGFLPGRFVTSSAFGRPSLPRPPPAKASPNLHMHSQSAASLDAHSHQGHLGQPAASTLGEQASCDTCASEVHSTNRAVQQHSASMLICSSQQHEETSPPAPSTTFQAGPPDEILAKVLALEDSAQASIDTRSIALAGISSSSSSNIDTLTQRLSLPRLNVSTDHSLQSPGIKPADGVDLALTAVVGELFDMTADSFLFGQPTSHKMQPAIAQ